MDAAEAPEVEDHVSVGGDRRELIGVGFRIYVVGLRVQGLGLGVQGGLGFGGQGSGFRVWDWWLRVEGLGLVMATAESCHSTQGQSIVIFW